MWGEAGWCLPGTHVALAAATTCHAVPAASHLCLPRRRRDDASAPWQTEVTGPNSISAPLPQNRRSLQGSVKEGVGPGTQEPKGVTQET